mgnify:CR=1 FL=1
MQRKHREALEDYLTTIYRLEEVFGVAHTNDIAKELGVSPATVSKILSKLEMRGLVKRLKYHGAKLTDEGRGIAEQAVRKHRILEVLLKSLGFNNYEAHRYAHEMEHIPSNVIERIYEFLNKPKFCPHGNPIPRSGAVVHKLPSLSNAETEKCYRVMRIAGEFSEPLKVTAELGIEIGTKLCVENKTSSVLTLIKDNEKVVLELNIAKFIYVEEVKQ